VVSPGISEEDARRALKCCIFNSLLNYIRRRVKTVKEETQELENRRRMLLGRIKHQEQAESSEQLQAQLQEVEGKLEQRELRLDSLQDHLEFVADVLAHPAAYVDGNHHELRLNRLGIKLEDGAEDAGYTVPLSEIRVACHQPRIATLVRFPREELLPRQDYLKKADLFLAV
jgi:vacuolar-type H+-ATPase subunit E/Vma4